jgi:Anti-sigma-K factor rskA
MSETGPRGQPDEAMVDLLIKQVTEGLSPAEQRALDVLDSEVASAYARDLERAAAAIAVAGSAAAEPPPAELRARIEEQARAFFASAAGTSGAGGESAGRVVEFKAPPGSSAVARRAAARGASAGWWAAAACLVLAVLGWLRAPAPLFGAAARPAEERAALLARPGSLEITLSATKDPAAAGVTGDVVWNPATQRGFLRFVGLPPNDPRVHQYQVWIFDGERDQRYPVDGGLFNVPENSSEVLVPIRAAVPVHAAKAFAVTIEKPGGVVVSARDHVVALAQTG